ncbi:hypothetical protein BC834DRAFT_841181 [Gloeopeniophorella convolvens]|nr:hypothetical protein BC834DRAFT_841181 [Gloeopeniophorella convolvens]
MSAPVAAPSPPRSTRPLAARKRPNDYAWFGPSATTTSTKRRANDRAEGEPRVKRKRVDATLASSSQLGLRADKLQEKQNDEPPMMDFSTLPVEALHRYLVQYDLVPTVHPSPLSALDPPPPFLLLNPLRGSSRGGSPAGVTTANRPRRESREQSRRRSSRLVEEEARMRTPVLSDIGEIQGVLASIAQRHFENQGVREVESLASFMCAVKGRGEWV